MLERPFTVAGNLFSWASEQGFIGVAAYVACWVFMFPVMVSICVAGAIIGWFVDKQNDKDARHLNGRAHANAPRNEVERRNWEEEDRRYEEAIAIRRAAKLPPT